MCLVIWNDLRDRRKEANKLRGAQVLILKAKEVVEGAIISVAQPQL